MNKQKIMKWALPGLLMSAVTFELMPGNVGCFVKDMISPPEKSPGLSLNLLYRALLAPV